VQPLTGSPAEFPWTQGHWPTTRGALPTWGGLPFSRLLRTTEMCAAWLFAGWSLGGLRAAAAGARVGKPGPCRAGARLGSRRRSLGVSSPVEINNIASSSSARGPRSPGTPSREYRSRMFSHRLATVCACQPIRSAVCFADRGAAGPVCRQFR
jgi:hypothetical protein